MASVVSQAAAGAEPRTYTPPSATPVTVTVGAVASTSIGACALEEWPAWSVAVHDTVWRPSVFVQKSRLQNWPHGPDTITRPIGAGVPSMSHSRLAGPEPRSFASARAPARPVRYPPLPPARRLVIATLRGAPSIVKNA